MPTVKMQEVATFGRKRACETTKDRVPVFPRLSTGLTTFHCTTSEKFTGLRPEIVALIVVVPAFGPVV
jgi:hypothetical protein